MSAAPVPLSPLPLAPVDPPAAAVEPTTTPKTAAPVPTKTPATVIPGPIPPKSIAPLADPGVVKVVTPPPGPVGEAVPVETPAQSVSSTCPEGWSQACAKRNIVENPNFIIVLVLLIIAIVLLLFLAWRKARRRNEKQRTGTKV